MRFDAKTMLGSLCAVVLLTGTAPAFETSLDTGFGATGGFGGQVGLTLENFTRDVPLSLRVSGAASTREAGKALDARHVFINDNTNGTPDESARVRQFRLDLLRPVGQLAGAPLRLGVGLRHAWFKGTFDFIGGNEKFDVTSSMWGAGVLVESAFPVTDTLDFTLQAGLDYFFDAKLEGHDTAYSPDGDHVNPRDGYDYDSADDAVNQPAVEPFGLIGVRILLGG